MDSLEFTDSHDYLERIDRGEVEPARIFCRLTRPDLRRMLYMVEQMKNTLFSLAKGAIPDSDYTLDDLQAYCASLVTGQYRPTRRTGLRPDGWPLTEEVRMPSDARVDFIFFPTYLAVATLCRVLLDYPATALRIRSFGKCLVRGQLFCTYRHLQGHGYDATRDMLQALDILCVGGVPKVVDEYPDYSHPALKKLLASIETSIREALAERNTRGAFGEDYQELFARALRNLNQSRR